MKAWLWHHFDSLRSTLARFGGAPLTTLFNVGVIGIALALPSGLYVGLVTSTKLHKSAVKRNRMRRRCREALRLAYKDSSKKASAQLLLLPRSSSLNCAFEELSADVQRLLASLPSS